jgi:hypothetical protein
MRHRTIVVVFIFDSAVLQLLMVFAKTPHVKRGIFNGENEAISGRTGRNDKKT